MKLVIACAALVFAARAANSPRQAGVDVQHYIFRIALGDASGEIAGESTARVRFVQDGVARVSFDLAGPREGKGMAVSEVTSSGSAVQHSHAENRLTVSLPVAPK